MKGQIGPIAGGLDNSRTPGGEQESRTGDSCADWGVGLEKLASRVASCEWQTRSLA